MGWKEGNKKKEKMIKKNTENELAGRKESRKSVTRKTNKQTSKNKKLK